jgi:hypothetical protein
MTTQAQYRAVPERRQLDNVVLNAAIVGTASTSVLRWDAAAIVNQGLGGWPATGTWALEVNSATLGTVIDLIRRGVYHVALGLTLEAGNNTAAGISLDAPAATLLDTAVPINTTAGIVNGVEQTTPAATQSPFNLAMQIVISDSAVAAAARGLVRFHATAGGEGGAPPAGITLATARYRVTYVGDVMGV